MDPVSNAQQLQVEPGTARVASMLRRIVGPPRAVVSHFVLTDDEGNELKASPSELLDALEGFRGGSTEMPETYFSRLASRLRERFK